MVLQAGVLRNYEIWLEGDGGRQVPILLKQFAGPSEFRPQLLHELTIENDSNLYRVVRIDPTTNPDTEPVKYYVVVANTVDDRPRFTGFGKFGL